MKARATSADRLCPKWNGNSTTKKSYLKRLARIRKGKFVRVESFAARYGL